MSGDDESLFDGVLAAVTGRTVPPHPDDAVQLQNLVQAYALLTDAARTAELAALFTEDAEWDGRELGLGHCARPADIASSLTSHHRPDEPMLHQQGPMLLVTLSEFEIRGLSSATATRWAHGTPVSTVQFRYDDVFRRDEAGVWRFARRRLRRQDSHQ